MKAETWAWLGGCVVSMYGMAYVMHVLPNEHWASLPSGVLSFALPYFLLCGAVWSHNK